MPDFESDGQTVVSLSSFAPPARNLRSGKNLGDLDGEFLQG